MKAWLVQVKGTNRCTVVWADGDYVHARAKAQMSGAKELSVGFRTVQTKRFSSLDDEEGLYPFCASCDGWMNWADLESGNVRVTGNDVVCPACVRLEAEERERSEKAAARKAKWNRVFSFFRRAA